MKVVPGAENNHIRILVVLMGSLGDVARGMCVAAMIKRDLPHSDITWLVEPAAQQLVELNNSVDRVIVFERPAGLRGVLSLRRELKASDFDICLDMQRHFKSGLFSYWSGAPRRIGFHRTDTKEFNWLFQTESIADSGSQRPKLELYTSFVRSVIGAKSDPAVRFGFEEYDGADDWSSLVAQRVDKPMVGVILGSSWESKDWVKAGYQELLGKLLADGISVVLMGGKEHKLLAAELCSAFEQSERVVNIAGETSIKQLVGILQRLDVCVGPDSGPGHIAAMLGVPVVSLFGPTDPVRVAPYNNLERVVQASLACSPCGRRKCPGLDRVCMRLISVDQIMERIREVI